MTENLKTLNLAIPGCHGIHTIGNRDKMGFCWETEKERVESLISQTKSKILPEVSVVMRKIFGKELAELFRRKRHVLKKIKQNEGS